MEDCGAAKENQRRSDRVERGNSKLKAIKTRPPGVRCDGGVDVEGESERCETLLS